MGRPIALVTGASSGIGLYLAFKLFEIGSLETGKRIDLKSAFRKA